MPNLLRSLSTLDCPSIASDRWASNHDLRRLVHVGDVDGHGDGVAVIGLAGGVGRRDRDGVSGACCSWSRSAPALVFMIWPSAVTGCSATSPCIRAAPVCRLQPWPCHHWIHGRDRHHQCCTPVVGGFSSTNLMRRRALLELRRRVHLGSSCTFPVREESHSPVERHAVLVNISTRRCSIHRH